jgi:hypothetical protein
MDEKIGLTPPRAKDTIRWYLLRPALAIFGVAISVYFFSGFY